VSRTRAVALLDVDVLVALFDPDHVHHDEAHAWYADHEARGWATCPLTENGFLRTAAALARTRQPVAVDELVEGLRTFTSHPRHEFWQDEISLLDHDRFDTSVALGHQQLTDVYLLALAVRHRGVLATFDRRIPLAAVRGARPEHLEVIAAGD
jgi:toxin-antitoxin system PIN domain toxin